METSFTSNQVTPVGSCTSELGEGPLWVKRESALYWVDIASALVWRMRWPSQECESWAAPTRVTALAPRRNGGFVAASDKGFAFLDFDRGAFELVHAPEPHLRGNRFNDGKVDRDGRFWAGTMDDAEEQHTGSLYRLDPDRRCCPIVTDYAVPNGPAFSLDGTALYHADSARQIVYRFALAADGTVGEPEVFLRFVPEDGYPDGMTVDAQDCLWIAFWDGWCLRRFSSDGVLIEQLSMPVQRPTSCAFGGPELEDLFITSARKGLSERNLAEQPLAGRLFVARPGCGGVAQAMFAG